MHVKGKGNKTISKHLHAPVTTGALSKPNRFTFASDFMQVGDTRAMYHLPHTSVHSFACQYFT